ncbi:MaoC/PaaZ C-terminal domain-containing protein [Halorientalis marina]|jgi:acyl dehydratase|uniref:MaoC/PaaZ C-terminal domain-containing protein n=1 Tax=Halorientalis marina TaxID=2931976 RepID=UPI001FF441BF|nr:MaoC/PaaZ C-terminal domain-containing protein [Halorientalis marina]
MGDETDVPRALRPGTTHTYERSFDHEDVHAWADISGDQQDRHFEADEAGRLLLHGLLTASLQTKIGGDLQVLASRMDLRYRRPVYTGQTIHCTWENETATEREDRYALTVAVEMTVEGTVVLDGTVEGVVMKADVDRIDPPDGS